MKLNESSFFSETSYFFCVLNTMKVFLARNRSKVRVLRVAEHTYFIMPALKGLEALVSSGTPVKSDDASMLSNDLEYSSMVQKIINFINNRDIKSLYIALII